MSSPESHSLSITGSADTPVRGLLDLREPGDEQFTKELAGLNMIIGSPKVSSDGLRFEFVCNTSYNKAEIGNAVSECVRKFKVRRGFQHATYPPRWSLIGPGQYEADFILHVFPLTTEVKEQLEANPAVASVSVISTKEGVAHIKLRQLFERRVVRSDLEEILRTFVGMEFVPEPEEADEKP